MYKYNHYIKKCILSYLYILFFFFLETVLLFFFFFFQAEDGIRDPLVTGVQTLCSSDLVRVHFDADLRPETVTTSTIQVRDSDGNPIGSQLTFDTDNHLATLTVTLQSRSTYQLVVTTGVTDINGVTMA